MKTQETVVTTDASVDAKILAARLEKLQPGEVVDYAELNALIDRDTQGKARACLNRARRIAQNGEQKIVTGCVFGKGIKRLSDGEIVKLPTATFSKVRRVVRVTSKKLGLVNYDKLTDEEKIEHNFGSSAMAVIGLVSAPSKLKVIEDAAIKRGDALAVNVSLKLFTEANS